MNAKMRGLRFWKDWGLVSRLMLAVGTAIVAGGGVQTYLLMAEGAAEHSARLKRELSRRSPSWPRSSPIRRFSASTR